MTDLKSKGHWMAATFRCQLQRWRPMPPRTQLVLVDKFRFSLFAPLTASSTTRPSCYQASSSIRRLPPASLGSQRSAERYVCLSLSLARHRSPSLGSHRARVSGLGARSAQDVDRWDGRDWERDGLRLRLSRRRWRSPWRREYR